MRRKGSNQGERSQATPNDTGGWVLSQAAYSRVRQELTCKRWRMSYGLYEQQQRDLACTILFLPEQLLHKKRWLLRLVQVLRASIVLGPFRKPIVRYYQKFGHNDLLKTEIHPSFPEVDPEQIVYRINEMGYAHVGNVPEEYVTQILDYCAIHKQTRYWNPHTNCEAVDRICRNAKLVEIARKYLGTEPILWLTLLRWSFPFSDNRAGFYPTTYRDPTEHDIHTFHYDIIDFKSLTLFVYLTDIDFPIGGFSPPEGRLARGFKPPAFSRFLFQSAVKSAESF
jgi:hypothetical protein